MNPSTASTPTKMLPRDLARVINQAHEEELLAGKGFGEPPAGTLLRSCLLQG